MIDINVTNFLTIGIIAAIFNALWHWLINMFTNKPQANNA